MTKNVSYTIDNRDCYLTDLRLFGHDIVVTVAPMDLVRNLIENMGEEAEKTLMPEFDRLAKSIDQFNQ